MAGTSYFHRLLPKSVEDRNILMYMSFSIVLYNAILF